MVVMKKIYNKVSQFVLHHRKATAFLSSVIFLVGCCAGIYSNAKILSALVFGFSLLTLWRLMTWRTGKIPIFMSDKTWDRYRIKLSAEEADYKFKEMSMKRATLYFFLSLIVTPIWILWELLSLLL